MATNQSPWPNFKYSELKCKCGKCGSTGQEMNVNFMNALQRLRTAFGKPLIITSAYRCKNHPVESGKSTTGAHVLGVAVDISIRGDDAVELLRLALTDRVFKGFGVSQKGASRFIHLDAGGGSLPRPMIWSY